MELSKRHKIILLTVVIIIFASISIREAMQLRSKTYILASNAGNEIEKEMPSEEPLKQTSDETHMIMVHVEGEVEKPGVYQLEEGNRVVDAIEMAGGLGMNADPKRINMALKLHDEMFLYIPQQGNDHEGDHELIFSKTLEDPTLLQPSTLQDGLININTADTRALETLPGIGPVLAQRIIDHRQQVGNFNQKEDLMNVTGIGDSRYRDVSDRITVR